jgi:hypothetical protein
MRGLWFFTSPSVYLAYDTIRATATCSEPGRTFTNGIITLRPDELSSVVGKEYISCIKTSFNAEYNTTVCGERYELTARSFNLADLQGPVPAAAYYQGFTTPCSNSYSDDRALTDENRADVPCVFTDRPIFNNEYYPTVALPDMIRGLDVAFEKCHPFVSRNIQRRSYQFGVWDPPITLQPITVMATPTLTLSRNSGNPSRAPSPAASFTSPYAQRTSPARAGNGPISPSSPNSPRPEFGTGDKDVQRPHKAGGDAMNGLTSNAGERGYAVDIDGYRDVSAASSIGPQFRLVPVLNAENARPNGKGSEISNAPTGTSGNVKSPPMPIPTN